MKMLKVLVAAAVLAAMVTPAIAEDRLSLNGEMRVRAWNVDAEAGGVDLGSDTWADQRLRIGGKISVAEGVSITFRTDITESNWGTGNAHGSGRTGVQQWDRAHLDITKGNLHLRAGQQYLGLGKTAAVDTQDNGLALDIAGAVPVKIFGFLNNDGSVAETAAFELDAELGVVATGDAYAAGETDDAADAFLFGVSAAPTSNSQLFVAGWNDGSDEEVYVIGANAAFDLDAIKLVAELDFFTGDADATTDAMGTQVFVDASTALDAATVGAQLFYALGDDTDEQYTSLGTQFGGWDPLFDVGTSLSNEQIGLGKPFDWTGTGAGAVGGRLYASTKMGAADFGASVAYLETEEDDVIEADVVGLAAGIVYPVMDNTTFQVQLEYLDGEVATVDFDAFQAGTGLFVKF